MMMLQNDISLARFNSWRLDGVARFFAKPECLEDWQQLLREIDADVPLCVLGLGSNVLIRQGGFSGLVIITHGGLSQIERVDTHHIRAEAGVPCSKLARFCAREGLAGLEFFAGIPGTVGGALRMNAGCFGGQTWERVVNVAVLNRQGMVSMRTPSDYKIAYRFVDAKQDEWFSAATFELFPDGPKSIQARVRHLINQRQATQPTAPSCGSVFKNPPQGHAAAMLDQCGLKGYTLGGAMVSDKHANFIINKNCATAGDVESLMLLMNRAVKEKFDVDLEPEVHIIGTH